MAFSNGFDIDRVKAKLLGRLGWRATTASGGVVLSDENKSAKSGRFFNEAHALCTVENIKALLDNAKATDAQVNAELEILQTGAIMRALTAVLNEPEILETGADFIRSDELNDLAIPSTGSFVGRRIRPAELADVLIQIDAVSLAFDADVDFKIYLFQEGRKTPIKDKQVAAVAFERTRIELEDFLLAFAGPGNLGGRFLFGYFQDDLADAKAIDEARFEQDPNLWGVEMIEAPALAMAEGATFPEFDRKRIAVTSRTGGLNLELSAFRNWTEAIVKKPGAFDELISLTMAATIVEKAIHTTRSNSTERILKEQLVSFGFMDLTGAFPAPDGPKIQGLRQRIEREAARVRKSFYPGHRAVNYSALC